MKKKYIILSITIVLLLIFSVLITSYAFFSVPNKIGNESVIKSGTMALRLYDGDEMVVTKLIPGQSIEKEFAVENTGNVATSYDIYLSEVINTFVDKTDLVYEITSTDDGYETTDPIQVQAPSASAKIIDSYPIGVGEIHHYKIKITFLAKNEEQDDNQGKTFKAKIQINEYRDLNTTINYYLDNELVSEMPDNTKLYLKYSCDKNGQVSFNTDDWTYRVLNVTQNNTTCNIYFKTIIPDTSNASAPELYQGLIPVMYDGTNSPMVADPSSQWYNYDQHEWANAVLVSNSSEYFDNGELKAEKIGTSITSGILQYYVWIPRYNYRLFNTNNGAVDEQMIEVNFEDCNATNGVCKEGYTKETGTQNNQLLTHPSFTFGSTELNGIWVGKFEATGSFASSSNPTALTTLPNLGAMLGNDKTISNEFVASRQIDTLYSSSYGLNSNEIDTHMMKNTDWGALAYLTHSKYGRYNADATCVSGDCEVTCSMVYYNPITGYGCSANDCTWNAKKSYKASTTYNQYGVYDMAGTNIEWVMGNQATNGGQFASSNAGFTTAPNSRYYDLYRYTSCCDSNYPKYMLGDATRETLKINTGDYMGSKTWYDGRASSIMGNYSWVVRGGDANCGLYKFGYTMGDKFVGAGVIAFRIVLTAQDGDSNTIYGN